MKTYTILIILLFFFKTVYSQEETLQKLYEETHAVSLLVDAGKSIDVLDYADSLMALFDRIDGCENYFAYLNVYKGVSYLSLGDFLLARHCDSLALMQAEQSLNRGLMFTINNNLAVIDLERGDFVACFNRCEGLLKKFGDEIDLDQRGMVMNNMAWCASKLGWNEIADSLYHQILPLLEENFDFDYLDPVVALRNFGQHLMAKGLFSEAYKYLSKATETSEERYGDDNYQTGLSALYLGQCLWKTGNSDQALSKLNQAVEVLDPDPDNLGFSQYELIRIRAYQNRAAFFRSRGEIEQSQQDILRAIDLIRFAMDFYSSSESAHIFSGIVRPVFDLAIQNEMALAGISHRKRHIDEAIRLSDLSKRMSLHAQINRTNRISTDTTYLKAFKDYHRMRLLLSAGQQSKDSLALYFDELRKKRGQLDRFGGVYSFSANERIRIPRHLLAYYEMDSSYLIFKRSGSRRLVSEISSELFIEKAEAFKKIISMPRKGQYGQHDLNEFRNLAGSLFELLMMPEERLRNRIQYIQPDGVLNGLAFDLLIHQRKDDKSDPGETFKEMLMPALKSRITYLVSLQLVKRQNYEKNESVGFFGPRDSINLGGSSVEFNALSGIKGWIFRRDDQDAEVLHFTGHSQANETDLFSSKLSELYNWGDILLMDNSGKNIYLNSCETGLGQYLQGEGLMSFGHAFLLSGAHQVVESYWQIPDQASRMIAIEFYQNGGFRNPVKSLSRARISYLNQAQTGLDHPHYWAGLNMIGYQEERSHLVIAVVTCLFMLLIFRKMCHWHR